MATIGEVKSVLFKILIKLLIYLRQDFNFTRQNLIFMESMRKNPQDMDRDLLGQAIRFVAHGLDKAKKCENITGNRGKEKYDLLKVLLNEWKERKYEWGDDKKWALQISNQYKEWSMGKDKIVTKITDSQQRDIKTDVFTVIEKRRSIRFWKKQPVPREIIDKIIKSATYAPISCNRMTWRFFVVENDLSAMIEGDSSNTSLLTKAPCRIYIAIDERLYPEIYAPALDAGIALQNMTLTAHALGIGTCLIYQCESIHQDKLLKYLDIPNHYRVYCSVLLGYPDEKPLTPARVAVKEVTKYIKAELGLSSFLRM